MSKFDKRINRYQTNSLKFDFKSERNKPVDVYPLWVADMDFKAPQPVLKKLKKAVSHGIFGYSEVKSDNYETLKNWLYQNHQLKINENWIIKTPGVVPALALAVQAFTNIGDYIAIFTPVYYPFYEVIEDNGRKVAEVPLSYHDGSYSVDFEKLEKKIIKHKIKLILLCNPHNPVGRIWRKDELTLLVSIAQKYHIIIVSDEIHMDLVYPPYKHTSLPLVTDTYDLWVVATSASKSFNLAGLQVANIVIKDDDLRTRYQQQLRKTGYSQHNVLGLIATQEAYGKGHAYLNELRSYLYDNYQYLKSFIEKNVPKIKVIPLEATYLVWLDFRAYQLKDEVIADFMINNAKLWLDDGLMFGQEGSGFQRINIALPRSELKKVLQRLKEVFDM